MKRFQAICLLLALGWALGLGRMAIAQSVVIKEVGRLTLEDGAISAAVSGAYCFVKNPLRLHVVDVTDPAAPRLLGAYTMPGNRIILSNSYLYIIGGNEYTPSAGDLFSIVDISNPKAVTMLGSIPLPYASDVFVAGGYAYVTRDQYPSRLYVVDISDPNNPWIVSFVETISAAHAVFAAGNYAYVAEGIIGLGGGVRIYDVSDPLNIRQAGVYFQSYDYAHRVFVVDNYVYLLSGTFKIVDFTEMALPLQMSATHIEDFLRHGIKVVGNRAFLTAYQMLYIMDVSDPTRPRMLGSYRPPEPSADIDLDDNYLYVPGWRQGLIILQYRILK